MELRLNDLTEHDLVEKIGARAQRMDKEAGGRTEAIQFQISVAAAHLNGCPLRLQALLNADDFNFAHDVFGLHRHVSRETGEVEGFFLPRFAAKQFEDSPA